MKRLSSPQALGILALLLSIWCCGLPAEAGISRPPPEISKSIGPYQTGKNGTPTLPEGPAANAASQQGVGSKINTSGSDSTASSSQAAQAAAKNKSNVGLFITIAVLVLGGTGAGIYFWSRKIA